MPGRISSIYIPLCFYFIGCRRHHHAELGAGFTFHYASTLSACANTHNDYTNRIYIPLCFYFIRYPEEEKNTCIGIYIPLCFYFIWIGFDNHDLVSWFTFHYASTLSWTADPEKLWDRYLHSTMLLLYQFAYEVRNNMGEIYIPLCFYFIETQLISVGYKLIDLHSTMLLLYQIWAVYSVCWCKFTFHYASTLSGIGSVRYPFHDLFTFHYASTLSTKWEHTTDGSWNIYIPLCFYFIRKLNPKCGFVLHLHSTMLLLYRMSGSQKLSGTWIYIPLCFYFIENKW